MGSSCLCLKDSVKWSHYVCLPKPFLMLMLGYEESGATEEIWSRAHLCITEKIKNGVPFAGFLNLWLQRVCSPRGNARLIPSATRTDVTWVLPLSIFKDWLFTQWFRDYILRSVSTWEVEHLEWGCQAVRVKEGVFQRMSKIFPVLRYFQEACN